MDEASERDPGAEAPRAKSKRPDWLVGAEEVVEGEAIPEGQQRPTLPASGPPPRAGVPGSGTPRAMPPGSQPPRSRLPDLDDATSRLAGWAAADMGPFSPAGGQAAEAEPASVAGREAERGEAPDPEDAAGPIEGVRHRPAPEREIESPPRRPIGTMALEVARRSWKWAAGTVAALLLATTLAQAIGIGTTSLHRILSDPARYDGARVKVRGRVGDDVFSVGGGYSFFLLQGRDSMVVFTRYRVPVARSHMSLTAQVSTGTLADALRPALLELDPRQR